MSSAERQTAFRRVADDLRTALAGDSFAAGVPLPTEAELCDRYGVSRQTVRRAFQDLVAEGLVVRVPGRGTFPASGDGRYIRQLGSIEDLMALSADSALQVLDPLTGSVDPAAAGRLHLPDDRVFTASFVRLHDGRPFGHTRVHLPPAVGRRLAEAPELAGPGRTSTVTVIGLLDQLLDEPIAEAEQSIAVASAPPDASAALGLAEGAAVLRVDRTYLDGAGTPVELAVSHFHPERYTYRVRLRRSRPPRREDRAP